MFAQLNWNELERWGIGGGNRPFHGPLSTHIFPHQEPSSCLFGNHLIPPRGSKRDGNSEDPGVSFRHSLKQWCNVGWNENASSMATAVLTPSRPSAVKQACFPIPGLPEKLCSYLFTNLVVHLLLILCVLPVIPVYYPELVSVACTKEP